MSVVVVTWILVLLAVLVAVPADQPPLRRMHGAMLATAIAEYFRDQGKNVLLLMDNVFRFVQAGGEVSGLLGRLPSRVGYQPTLATEIAELEERIARFRTERDATLDMPRLIIPSLQVNMRAGRMPEPDEKGDVFLKVPVNKL